MQLIQDVEIGPDLALLMLPSYQMPFSVSVKLFNTDFSGMIPALYQCPVFHSSLFHLQLSYFRLATSRK
jgi:hypothetical protein